jgi:hypothetical protein
MATNQTADSSAVTEIKKLLEQAKQEAAEILAAAREEAAALTGGKKSGLSPDVKALSDRAEEAVEIRLFKDGGRYKDDVFVAVNGEGCLIRRGETVRVKRKFADVLESGMMQDERTAEMQNKYADEFASETRARGL